MNLNWDEIGHAVATGVNALAPIAEGLAPEVAPAISIVNRIIQAAMKAEPTAVALVQQIQSGAVPSQTQLAEFYATFQHDDDALEQDIEAHLAALKG